MSARTLVRPRVVAAGSLSINTATTSNVDFGTPDDLKLNLGTNFRKEDRLVVVITARTAGTTDPISFSIQDAPDNAGAIGTPATAVTDGVMTGGTGNQNAVVALRPQTDRPWIRVRATRTGTTDTHLVSVVVLAFSPSI